MCLIMKRLLIIGCGDVGLRLIPLAVARYRVYARIYALTRDASQCAALRALGVTPMIGDLDKPQTLSSIAGIAHDVVHLAPPPAAGVTDTRTAHLIAALMNRQRAKNNRGSVPQHFVYISTSGVYGDCGGALVGEARPLCPGNARARRRVDAERQLARVAKQRGMFLIILRVPGIYAADRLPLDRLKAGTPAIVAAEDSYTNHIHAADLAAMTVRAMHHALRRRPPRVRVYNANDDSDMKMGDYFDLVAQAFGLPAPPRLPRAAIAGAVSPMLLSFMRESRRLDNARQKRELRLAFQFPTVADGLSDMRRLA